MTTIDEKTRREVQAPRDMRRRNFEEASYRAMVEQLNEDVDPSLAGELLYWVIQTQWASGDTYGSSCGSCPECCNSARDGHRDDCRIGNLIERCYPK